MSWTSFTSFSFQLDNAGLSASTWLGDLIVPNHTLALTVALVVGLRVRKVIKDKLAQRKADTYAVPPTLDFWNDATANPFDDFA